MNAMFKEIRNGEIDKIRLRIEKNPKVVNEYFNGKAPKKDIGQSPLQVALKCGQFDIIELLIENGANPDFMEDPATVPPHSVCMSVLHDAVNYAFASLCYKDYNQSDKYISLIKKLLEMGADPNRETSSGMLPIGSAVNSAEMILGRRSAYPDIQEITKNSFFVILDILIEHGADKEKWLEQDFWGVSNKVHYLEEKMIMPDGTDCRENIRNILKEYFG